MSGEVNPKTGVASTAKQQQRVDLVSPHRLLQNLAVHCSRIKGISLSNNRDTAAFCQVGELKAMAIARGGNVTSHNGKALLQKELQRIARACLAMKTENSRGTVFFSRDKCMNGIFSNRDMYGRSAIYTVDNGPAGTMS